jgi:hypothetical protein
LGCISSWDIFGLFALDGVFDFWFGLDVFFFRRLVLSDRMM